MEETKQTTVTQGKPVYKSKVMLANGVVGSLLLAGIAIPTPITLGLGLLNIFLRVASTKEPVVVKK